MDRYYSEIANGRFNQKTTGSFRAVPDNVVLRIVVTIVVFAAIIGMLLVVSENTVNSVVALVFDLSVLVLVILCVPVIRMQYAGDEWTYTITDKQFSLIKKGCARNYKYADVEGASYVYLLHPITRKKIGYTVTVKTKYRSDKYNYLSSFRGETLTPQKTPFYVLNEPPVPPPEFDRFS